MIYRHPKIECTVCKHTGVNLFRLHKLGSYTMYTFFITHEQFSVWTNSSSSSADYVPIKNVYACSTNCFERKMNKWHKQLKELV